MGSFGVVIVSGDDDLMVSGFQNGRIEAFPGTIKPSNAPWPSVAEGTPSRVYWISRGRLVRRKVSSDGIVGALEVLANDAADYTHLAVARGETTQGPDVVAYIGRTVSKELERSARVWIEGKGARALSPDGAGATSVYAVALGAGKFALLSVDGRLSLSPIHARFLEIAPDGAPSLAEDHVVYVAGPAENTVELSGIRVGSATVAFAPISRDTSAFGLLSLLITPAEGEAPSAWLMYPNGVTPAPVESTDLCGKPTVAWVQPEDETPGAKKTLLIGTVNEQGVVSDPLPLASGDKIRHIAFASIRQVEQPPLKGGKPRPKLGALIAYGADNVLKARAVACR